MSLFLFLLYCLSRSKSSFCQEVIIQGRKMFFIYSRNDDFVTMCGVLAILKTVEMMIFLIINGIDVILYTSQFFLMFFFCFLSQNWLGSFFLFYVNYFSEASSTNFEHQLANKLLKAKICSSPFQTLISSKSPF